MLGLLGGALVIRCQSPSCHLSIYLPTNWYFIHARPPNYCQIATLPVINLSITAVTLSRLGILKRACIYGGNRLLCYIYYHHWLVHVISIDWFTRVYLFYLFLIRPCVAKISDTYWELEVNVPRKSMFSWV